MPTQSIDRAAASGLPLVIAGVTSPTDTEFVYAAGDAAPDSVFALHSVTKAFTATAALQCVQDGLIDLDAAAREYYPELGDIEVLEELGSDGSVRTRPPVREVTVRDLLLHRSGFAYDMFDERYAILARARMAHPSATPVKDSVRTPLLHDPGERWTYGTSLDWLGFVVAEVRGERLNEVFRRGIYEPCGMHSTSFDVTPAMRERLVPVRRRSRDGQLRETPPPPEVPELDMGGQGLYSTVSDTLKFLRVWLGDGSAPHGQVLEPETIAWAVQGDPDLQVTAMPVAIPSLAREAEFFPGLRKSWAYSFLVNEEDVPGGRRAGSLTWSGLANTHYWIDRASGVAAIWTAQLMPFYDPEVMAAFGEFEQEVYAERAARP